MMVSSSVPVRQRHPTVYVLADGLIAGTLDMAYACTFWALKAAVPAQRIFQSVVAGLLGKASFEGGAATATLGLARQYFIATTMSVVYYLVARRWPLLCNGPFLRRRVRTDSARRAELRSSCRCRPLDTGAPRIRSGSR
jgi:predicted ABC-type sugar transport system permease subunit